jgi:ketosteroid isomerase-like protein
MSEENVQRIRASYDYFARTGTPDLELLDPDVEAYDPPGVPDPRVYRGRDGFLENLRNLSEAFDDLRWEAEEFIDADDKVIVATRMKGRGKESQVEVEQRVFHVWTLREGRAVALQTLFSREDALETTGLRE